MNGHRKISFCACLLFLPQLWLGFAQESSAPQAPAPAPQNPPQAAQAPAPAQPKPQPEIPANASASSDSQFSLALVYWAGKAHPSLRSGAESEANNVYRIDLGSKTNSLPGVIASFPAGRHNTLRFSYVRSIKAHSNTVAANDMSVFGANYAAGDALSTAYTLQNVKVSLDFLSWPFPVHGRQFLVKTLWEVQYASVTSEVNSKITDSSGQVIDNPGRGTNYAILPTLGLGIEHLVSRNFRWEAKASGFALPGRSLIVDGEITAAYRAGRIEVFFGAKGFDFKTSAKGPEYVRGMLTGGFFGIRYYP